MPISSSVFTRNKSWTDDRDNSIKITAPRHDDHDGDIADALNAIMDGSAGFIGSIKADAGTVLLPGVAFNGDTDTGMYRVGANSIGFATLGTLAMSISASQVVNFINGPTAPTATAGTNTTQVATTAFVQTAVSVLSFDAADVTLTPAGNIAATDVQAAIEELDNEKQAILSEGAFANGDKTKLDGIESGATADQSAAEILAALLTVDTDASGLNATTLQGNAPSAFLTSVPSTAGGVGTYVLASYGASVALGASAAGSSLSPTAASGAYFASTLSGTWQAMGYISTSASNNADRVILWLRTA